MDEGSGEEEEKCPEGFEYNSVLNVCDDVDEVISFNLILVKVLVLL